MNELVKMIQEFNNLVEKTTDSSPKSIYDFYFFFKTLPSTKYDNIPFIELGTILKYKKPAIYNGLKCFSDKSYIINVVTSIEMDLQIAMNNINSILETESN